MANLRVKEKIYKQNNGTVLTLNYLLRQGQGRLGSSY
jgi:hypothetical protein